jgi:uncharacterized cofD-like protein
MSAANASVNEETHVVAIGGGHGLAVVLRALRRCTSDITALVSTADDGGSSGRLRDELAVPGVGDLRKALVALADQDRPITRAMHHRFGGDGQVSGHALGNFILAALTQRSDLTGAVHEVADLLGVTGSVIPVHPRPVTLSAITNSGAVVQGQVAIMSTPGLARVWTEPLGEAVPQAALDAIAAADFVTLGPGSLYTSVLAACTPGPLRDALATAPGRVVYLCNLGSTEAESDGMSVADHVQALLDHGVRVDEVLYDPARIEVGTLSVSGRSAQLADASGVAHDVALLAAALARIGTMPT